MKNLALGLFAAIGLSTAAQAADMAVKARPLPPAPVFNWTGFYVGAHVGGGWFNKDWYIPLTPINIAGGCGGCPASAGGHDGTSWLAGGQVGFNYQSGMWVFGVELDGSWTDFNAWNVNPQAPFLRNNTRTDALGTFAGRVGIASNQALFYAKGGGAVANDRFFTTFNAPPNLISHAIDDTRWGWMVGVGIEYAFAPNWSIKAEYNHLDFGNFRETLLRVPGGGFPFQYDVRQTVDLVKMGINYRFGWAGPVVAKY
jgi:outer membrane immunogenic protein